MLMRCSKSESLPHLTTVWRRRKAPWDQPISGETLEKWLDWKSSLPLLREITVSRCYLSRLEHKGVTFQLHHFCDASESGYGTVSYLRFEYLDGFTECAFVTGKSRNAPRSRASAFRGLSFKERTLAARIDSAVRRELDFMWSIYEIIHFFFHFWIAVVDESEEWSSK